MKYLFSNPIRTLRRHPPNSIFKIRPHKLSCIFSGIHSVTIFSHKRRQDLCVFRGF